MEKPALNCDKTKKELWNTIRLQYYRRREDNHKNTMRRRYEVRWYELNLTKEKCRKFFTKLGAAIFAAYLEACEDVEPKVKEI